MEFEWDPQKEAANIKKHGISFITASKLFLLERFVARSDRDSEIRYLTVGEVEGRVLAVVYTSRKGKYRIISARRARKNEEKIYQASRKLSSQRTTH